MMSSSGQVYIYMQDWLPCRDGSGTNNRMYSNVRAYLDLGYEVEVICVQTKPGFEFEPEGSLEGVRWTHLRGEPPISGLGEAVLNRGAYWLGWPVERMFDYQFKTRSLLRAEVLRREALRPGGIHHFEYLATACTAIQLGDVRCIWSLHDIESNFLSGHFAMRREVDGREPRGWEKRSLRYVREAERRSARESQLVLCIARHECEYVRLEWGCDHAVFFPMSLPTEEAPVRTRGWMEGGKLRLFHLGRIDSLPSFRSLQFLLEQVFPRLSERELEAVEMEVVGEIRESERARTILKLAEKYPQVRLAGFQKEIRGFYGGADVQVVGSTEATGLRTRIIESFAWGVPVLSTGIGAEGVEGLLQGRNILLADDPESYAAAIRGLLQGPGRLGDLAEAGLGTYREIYSRAAVAARLQVLLGQYLAS